MRQRDHDTLPERLGIPFLAGGVVAADSIWAALAVTKDAEGRLGRAQDRAVIDAGDQP